MGLNCTMKYATRAATYGHVSNKHLEELNKKPVVDNEEETKENNKEPLEKISVKKENVQDFEPEASTDNAVETGEDNELDQDEFENNDKMETTSTGKKSKDYRTCKYCSKELHRTGLKMHENSCQKKSMVS